jgi:hypothetical protein
MTAPSVKKDDAKGLLKLCFAISVVLTVVTWLFFRSSSVTSSFPPTPAETTVIFGFWLVVVTPILFLWRRYHTKKEP